MEPLSPFGVIVVRFGRLPLSNHSKRPRPCNLFTFFLVCPHTESRSVHSRWCVPARRAGAAGAVLRFCVASFCALCVPPLYAARCCRRRLLPLLPWAWVGVLPRGGLEGVRRMDRQGAGQQASCQPCVCLQVSELWLLGRLGHQMICGVGSRITFSARILLDFEEARARAQRADRRGTTA